MPRFRDEPVAVRVYTVCDESRYLIVRNVPALGCGDDLMRLFATYGEVEECKPMDAEECEAFTDVYWIKFHLTSNARFAKRKLDESVFLGNKLQVSYAPQFESLDDTKDKLEGRRLEVLARLNPNRSKGYRAPQSAPSYEPAFDPMLMQYDNSFYQNAPEQRIDVPQHRPISLEAPITRVSSDKEYFTSPSMNQTVRTVREKLHKIQESTDQKRAQASSQQHREAEPAPKRSRADGRRRI